MQSDIEIYLHKANTSDVLQWLQHKLNAEAIELPGGSKKTHKYELRNNQGVVPLLMVKHGQWTSVWLDSPQTPWADDLACAQDAVTAMATTARCTASSWQEGDDPDAYLEVTTDGVNDIIWTD